MAIEIRKCILTKNDCYKAGRKIKVQGIMVHSTGANNPYLRRYVGPDDGLLGPNPYGNHWNQPKPGGQQKCVHAFIGKLKDGSIATYQTLPWDHRGWHAGGKANDTHIGFEICEDDLSDPVYFARVYREAVELCAYLCRQFGLAEKDIICHAEGAKLGIASNHADIMHWFPRHNKNMDDFRAEVKKALEPPKKASDVLYYVQTGAYSVKANADTQYYKVKAAGFDAIIKKSGNLYRVQVGAFAIRDNAENMAKKVKAAGFDVYITTEGGTTVAPGPESKPATQAKTIKVGSKVKVRSGAKTYDGKGLASFVYKETYDVIEIKGDRVVIGKGKAVTAAVKKQDLILI